MDRKKKKKLTDYEDGLKKERQRQVECRRQMRKAPQPKAREYAVRESAMPGLTQ